MRADSTQAVSYATRPWDSHMFAKLIPEEPRFFDAIATLAGDGDFGRYIL
jgi:hypothetical protein